MDTRYINAEHRLALALEWTDTDYTSSTNDPSWRACGMAPGTTIRTAIPAWARSNDACVELMLAHHCFVSGEIGAGGHAVMAARWKGEDGFEERIAVLTSEHPDAAAAFRYAALLGVTQKVERDSTRRALDAMVRS